MGIKVRGTIGTSKDRRRRCRAIISIPGTRASMAMVNSIRWDLWDIMAAENMPEEVYEFVLYLVIILPFWDSYEQSFRCSSIDIFLGGAFRCSTTRNGLHQPCHPGPILSIKPKNRLSTGIVYSAPNAAYKDQRSRWVGTLVII